MSMTNEPCEKLVMGPHPLLEGVTQALGHVGKQLRAPLFGGARPSQGKQPQRTQNHLKRISSAAGSFSAVVVQAPSNPARTGAFRCRLVVRIEEMALREGEATAADAIVE